MCRSHTPTVPHWYPCPSDDSVLWEILPPMSGTFHIQWRCCQIYTVGIWDIQVDLVLIRLMKSITWLFSEILFVCVYDSHVHLVVNIFLVVFKTYRWVWVCSGPSQFLSECVYCRQWWLTQLITCSPKLPATNQYLSDTLEIGIRNTTNWRNQNVVQRVRLSSTCVEQDWRLMIT